MTLRSFLVFVGCLLAVACSAGESAAPTSLPAVAPDSITFTIPQFAVAAESEVQRCYYMKAPTDVDLDIGNVVIDFSKGTHHMHVYWGKEDHADGVEDCFQAVDFDKWHLLVGAQKEHLEWKMPDGVAIKMKARQQLVIQVHFVNAGLLKTDGDNGHGSVRFDPLPPGVATMYMGSIFGQQRKISLPPKSKQSVDGVCRIPHDINMGALAGHYHFRGHDFVGYRMASDGSDGPEFYKSLSFGEPKFAIYDKAEPLSFTKGERILWRCNYANDTDMAISFGPREIDQEHCNMFAFFYPAAPDNPQEFLPCVSFGRCKTECKKNETCSLNGECEPAGSCAAKCDGKSCGDDGCGGSCGSCATSDGCTGGKCVPSSCTPSCSGKTCGDDGCGGTCGSCTAGKSCSPQGACVAGCAPSCAGKTCGPDGCGGVCGMCALGSTCAAGSCAAAGCDSNGGKEVEPNNFNSSPTALCADGTIHGAISSSSDYDWLTWQVTPGAHYNVTLDGLSSDLTFDVYRLSSTGSGNINKVNSAFDPGGIGPRTYGATTPIGGTFYAKVFAPTGAAGPYSLRVTQSGP
jgi:Copper type II ascorbate-dependent monooxygenase, C-terminal domain